MESLRKESADLVIQWMNASRENFPPSVNRQREAFQCFSSGAILLGLSVGRRCVVDNWRGIGQPGRRADRELCEARADAGDCGRTLDRGL